jgi:hypothetical protein
MLYIFLFLNVLNTWTLLVEYIKAHKKIEMILWAFDKGKELLIKKKPHVFLKCFKHIKGLLKHGEFSWNFCSCNFESIKIYFKNIYILIYSVPWWKFSKNSFKDSPHTTWFFLIVFLPFSIYNLLFTF